MPTYVYECSKCNQVFEKEQRISEDPLKNCECGGKNSLKRLIQPTAVMFKGSGFHINDYSSTSDASSTETKSADTPACSGQPESCPSCSPTED